jgi:hypothetical protein
MFKGPSAAVTITVYNTTASKCALHILGTNIDFKVRNEQFK